MFWVFIPFEEDRQFKKPLVFEQSAMPIVNDGFELIRTYVKKDSVIRSFDTLKIPKHLRPEGFDYTIAAKGYQHKPTPEPQPKPPTLTVWGFQKLYWKRKKSIQEIASIYGISEQKVSEFKKIHKIADESPKFTNVIPEEEKPKPKRRCVKLPELRVNINKLITLSKAGLEPEEIAVILKANVEIIKSLQEEHKDEIELKVTGEDSLFCDTDFLESMFGKELKRADDCNN